MFRRTRFHLTPPAVPTSSAQRGIIDRVSAFAPMPDNIMQLVRARAPWIGRQEISHEFPGPRTRPTSSSSGLSRGSATRNTGSNETMRRAGFKKMS